ncbi:MAG: AraC family transcriptional regulator [Planctomycetota bacterium]|nr:AraC family transcriptional regulator [Planctomycetota bacterium]
MEDVQETIRRVIRRRILPWVESNGISKLILPDQITPADCTEPIECKQPPRWRSRRQMLIVGLTGKAPYCIDNKNFIFTPGRIMLLPGGVRRGPAQTITQFVENLDPDRRSSFMVVESYLSGMWIQLLRVVPGKDKLEGTWRQLFLGRHFSRLTSCLLEEVRSRNSNYDRISRCLLMEFWVRCLGTDTAAEGLATAPPRRPSTSKAGRSISLTAGRQTMIENKNFPERVRIAEGFIHSHYHMPITLDDIASAADSSVNHLGRQFKTATGMTPIQYLLEVRMEAARQLLLTDMKISEVAGMVGIESPPYFSKVFLNSNGITPRQFRQKIARTRAAFNAAEAGKVKYQT